MCIFVMFNTFQDEMQYIFLEKNFIIMDFLACVAGGFKGLGFIAREIMGTAMRDA